MIRPTKYTDLNLSTLNVSSFILKELKQEPSLIYNELLEKITEILGDKARFVFIDALNFLYSIGLVDYNIENDAIYHLKKEGAIKDENK